jgi:hypothetical protein
MNTEISIINNSHRIVTKERSPNTAWDNSATITINSIEGFTVIEPDEEWGTVDLTVSFEIDPAKTYYLVSVIYTDGDSFNCDEGQISYIDLYEDSKLAIKTKKSIEDNYKDKEKKDSHSVEILTCDGCPYTISSSLWTGYFNSLQEVRIDRILQKL